MNKEQLLLEEWKITYQGTMHFNDLLMRLRTLGLPAVVTITGLAAAYGMNKTILQVKAYVIGIILILLSLVLFGLVIWLSTRQYLSGKAMEEGRRDTCLWPIEKYFWWSIPIISSFYAIYFWVDFSSSLATCRSVPLGIFLIAFGLMLLIAFYALDRFYYYCLLIGAVIRLTEIEDKLHFNITATISSTTPRSRSAAVTTALYYLPGIIGYIALLTIFTFL
jgi:hypothetical protein